MKYLAKEDCFFNTGTEVKIIKTLYNDLGEPNHICSGQWSMYLLGVKEPEIRETVAFCLPCELDIVDV